MNKFYFFALTATLLKTFWFSLAFSQKDFDGILTSEWLTQWGYDSSSEYLNLASKSIKSIQHGAFEGFTNVEYLDLEDNSIISIDSKDTFKGLVNLKTLILSRNSLKNFVNGAFSELVNLEYLDLWDNLITSVSAGMLSG
jgi:hypothetical protein